MLFCTTFLHGPASSLTGPALSSIAAKALSWYLLQPSTTHSCLSLLHTPASEATHYTRPGKFRVLSLPHTTHCPSRGGNPPVLREHEPRSQQGHTTTNPQIAYGWPNASPTWLPNDSHGAWGQHFLICWGTTFFPSIQVNFKKVVSLTSQNNQAREVQCRGLN